MGICRQLLAKMRLPVNAAIAISLAAASFSASATRQVDAAVTSLGERVSYSSTASEPYRIGYQVAITNTGNSNVNNVRFEGTLNIPDGLLATFEVSDGASCTGTPVGASTFVTCTLGTFPSRTSRTFALYFRSPVNTADSIERVATFATATYYAEGTNDTGSSNDTVIRNDDTVTLGTNLPNEVRSALLPAGGTFATQTGDAFNTRVTVPPQTRYSSVAIVESISTEVTCTTQRNFVQCFATNVDVPEVVFLPADPNFLTFDLVVAGSNIRKGAKIDRVLIRYEAPTEYGLPAVGPLPVQLCARVAGQPVPNNDYTPCIAARTVVKRGSPGWTPQTDGSFRWTIINKKNGRFDLF
jgi:hypothetical protein